MPDANDLGEVSFLTRSRHAVAEALALVWADLGQSEETKMARCEWILEYLYIDITGLRRAAGLVGTPAFERQLSAWDAVLLFISGLVTMPIVGGNGISPWEGYVDWIWNKVFQRRCGSEPEFLDSVATHLTRIFRA